MGRAATAASRRGWQPTVVQRLASRQQIRGQEEEEVWQVRALSDRAPGYSGTRSVAARGEQHVLSYYRSRLEEGLYARREGPSGDDPAGQGRWYEWLTLVSAWLGNEN